MSVQAETCLHPQLAPESGWRYGCRCSRCRTRAHDFPSSGCEVQGCKRLRLKGGRRCAEHVLPRKTAKRIQVEACLVCGHGWSYYESTVLVKRPEVREVYRLVCAECRRAVSPSIRRHRLDAEQALRFLTVAVCDCCGEKFPTRWARRQIEVDHDHGCCPGGTSCGRCVRGFVCSTCNREIGQWEAMQRRGRGPQIAAYLAAHEEDIDW